MVLNARLLINLCIYTYIVTVAFRMILSTKLFNCSSFLIAYQNGTPHLGQQYNKYKVILLSIGIIVIKSKGTRVVTYTCRYSCGHLIPIIQLCQDELGIKGPLEYLQVYR